MRIPGGRDVRADPRSGHRAEALARRCFVLGIAGLPLWWLLGVSSFVPLLMCGPLAWDLWLRRRVLVPPHFGWWLLFLLWVTLGALTLFAAAPGAVDDGGGGRLLVFGFRWAWYVACTVVLVWLGNTSRELLSDVTVHRILAGTFAVAVAGGLLGLAAPDLAITTVAERILPGGLRSNGFVATLISAEAADVQLVLGDPNPRPKAPFAYTNTWGSVMSLTLVFFVAAMASATRRWRWVAAPVIAVATVPIVLSLNRGLWVAVTASAVGALLLLVLRRRPEAIAALVAGGIAVVAVVALTPLDETLAARLENPHSNDRRSQLLAATVESMSTGSPAVGFGSTRDVQGSFTSIAGGATPDCPACGVPPLGTQGQLWLVLFSQGWIGTLFFLAFIGLCLAGVWRCRTTNQTVATFVVAVYVFQLLVYDTLGLPLMVVMIALALAWREAGTGRPLRRPRPAELAVVASIGLVGATVGGALAVTAPQETLASATVRLTPTSTYLDADSGLDPTYSTVELRPEETTVDTEAALLAAEATMQRAGDRVGMAPAPLRDTLSLSAPPLSSVLVVTASTDRTVGAGHSVSAEDIVVAVTEEYVAERQRYLDQRQADLAAELDGQIRALDPADASSVESRQLLRAALDHLTTNPQQAGQLLRVTPARPIARDPAVPVATGLGVGLLLGVALTRIAAGRRAARHERSTP